MVRPIVPTSLEQWSEWEKLLTIMNDFDAKAELQIGISSRVRAHCRQCGRDRQYQARVCGVNGCIAEKQNPFGISGSSFPIPHPC